MSINMNAAESVEYLQEEMAREVAEMNQLQREIQQTTTKITELKGEIPQKQKEIDMAKHELYKEETALPGLKQRYAEAQRDKQHLQTDLNNVQRALHDALKKK